MKYIITIIITYLIGCFSSAYIVGKFFKKIDIRNFGSGNVGSTNALRVMGTKLGVVTFLLDVLKGILAVYVGQFILGDIGGVIGGFFAVVGHNWPVFIGFKGGKGVATSIGVLLTLLGPIILLPLIITVIIILISKYVSLGSMSFLTLTPIIYIAFIRPFRLEYFLITFIFAIFGLIRHKGNIKKLIDGNENKINIGK